ncbi:isoaspartyl peptidase/L-asparaginase family protein [Mesoterricola sediminis]|uniref:Isoaspartyl peptidase n=1 Tax=Mesoterricola sediminis TaxID=2927980 RepID=A0AA48GZ64_9BACT|nr:isoaspartyl peptidase/L-asparaginase [Mesoterricola sediminis]BDU76727.1 isoaspartyl peptidase/L-asparaginase [Mesoterricola sediminis]
MIRLALLLLAGALAFAQAPFGLVVHGGAGSVTAQRYPPPADKPYRDGLERALAAGYAILEKGGSAVDAVEAAVRVLEEDPHFNAGIGATVTRAGTHELDAAIMDGATLKAGAVAGLQHVKSPIGLARLVMDRTPHVLLIGEGAEAFARSQGLEPVPNTFFRTPAQWEAYQKAHKPVTRDTVGAVALDRKGNLAAATSTGGMLDKLPGRVGDAPLIGAGTYADNRTCAVSCTGWGEFFIRAAVAHDVSARMEYKGDALAKAAADALDKATRMGGPGGLIALDAQGHYTLPFTTPGMFRAVRLSTGVHEVKLFGGA